MPTTLHDSAPQPDAAIDVPCIEAESGRSAVPPRRAPLGSRMALAAGMVLIRFARRGWLVRELLANRRELERQAAEREREALRRLLLIRPPV